MKNASEVWFVALACVVVLAIVIWMTEDSITSPYKKKIQEKKALAEKQNKVIQFDKNIERLEKLGKLHRDGVISKEEFDEQKSKFKL
jgi:hypothetical protein